MPSMDPRVYLRARQGDMPSYKRWGIEMPKLLEMIFFSYFVKKIMDKKSFSKLLEMLEHIGYVSRYC